MRSQSAYHAIVRFKEGKLVENGPEPGNEGRELLQFVTASTGKLKGRRDKGCEGWASLSPQRRPHMKRICSKSYAA